ncbi:hypothetical protein M514_05283 [Trichuris suis]|uniref:Uncharacterized protein n=1 Tax=Trichuris suis TaxID=68888 RepID=A0A085NQ26_9BILA|nr:hypothetical protein M514_05283 [Trichuris suis]
MPFNITSVDQRQSRAGSHMEHRCVQLPTGISALRYKQHMASEIECIIHPAFSRSYAAVPSSADGAAGDQLGCLHPGDRFQCSPSQMRSTRSGGIICDIMTTRDSLRRQMHGAFPFNHDLIVPHHKYLYAMVFVYAYSRKIKQQLTVPYNRYVTFTECVWLCFYKTEREGQFREFHEFHPLAWNLRNSQI